MLYRGVILKNVAICSGWRKALCLQPGVKGDDGSDEYDEVDGEDSSGLVVVEVTLG